LGGTNIDFVTSGEQDCPFPKVRTIARKETRYFIMVFRIANPQHISCDGCTG
jgi:hypothetical protein